MNIEFSIQFSTIYILVEISKGSIEILQDAGFTVEKILEDEPSHIA